MFSRRPTGRHRVAKRAQSRSHYTRVVKAVHVPGSSQVLYVTQHTGSPGECARLASRSPGLIVI